MFIEEGGQESGTSSEEQGDHPSDLQAEWCKDEGEKELDFVHCHISAPTMVPHTW